MSFHFNGKLIEKMTDASLDQAIKSVRLEISSRSSFLAVLVAEDDKYLELSGKLNSLLGELEHRQKVNV
jgi:hypothetical protein